MSEPVHPFHQPAAEKLKAIQYIFDVTRTAPAPAAVHDQTRAYAQFLADSLNPPPAVGAGQTADLAKVIEAAKTETPSETSSETPSVVGRRRPVRAAS